MSEIVKAERVEVPLNVGLRVVMVDRGDRFTIQLASPAAGRFVSPAFELTKEEMEEIATPGPMRPSGVTIKVSSGKYRLHFVLMDHLLRFFGEDGRVEGDAGEMRRAAVSLLGYRPNLTVR